MHGHGFAKWYCEQVPHSIDPYSAYCIWRYCINLWILEPLDPLNPKPLVHWTFGPTDVSLMLSDSKLFHKVLTWDGHLPWEPVGSSECMKCMLWVKFQCSIWTSMFSIIDWEPIAYHSTSLQTCKQQIMQIDDFLTTCIIFETTCSSVPLSAPPCLFLHLRASFCTSLCASLATEICLFFYYLKGCIFS